ncbi:hypothetical protein JTB14_030875 [Gonioctena quinquepunctata]|nr:hypothetical protein JTB14_030875 [Gonioctena quinquepunctata]
MSFGHLIYAVSNLVYKLSSIAYSPAINTFLIIGYTARTLSVTGVYGNNDKCPPLFIKLKPHYLETKKKGHSSLLQWTLHMCIPLCKYGSGDTKTHLVAVYLGNIGNFYMNETNGEIKTQVLSTLEFARIRINTFHRTTLQVASSLGNSAHSFELL